MRRKGIASFALLRELEKAWSDMSFTFDLPIFVLVAPRQHLKLRHVLDWIPPMLALPSHAVFADKDSHRTIALEPVSLGQLSFFKPNNLSRGALS